MRKIPSGNDLLRVSPELAAQWHPTRNGRTGPEQVGVNDLATTHPQLAQEWHTEKNYPLTPQQVVQGNVRKVWWKCSAGHEWQAQIAPRAAGNGCP